MVADSNELVGQTLGTCTLQDLIGRGGMGAVYLARQSRPRRTVAVKVLMPGNFLDRKSHAEFLARFRREADSIAALDHVHIMPIYEYGEQEDLAYLVMPYVTGGTLREVLAKRGILPIDETLRILEQATSALDCAHARGIVHRDLKPGNILFHADGRVLLADFGLAKTLKEAKEFESHANPALTSTGTIIGTPEYLSPEQGTGRPLDHRTDIYSIGIVLFQMLAGRVPFTGASPVSVAIKHAMEEPPSLAQFNPTIPIEVEAIVRKAISKEPEERYTSAGELARAFRAAVTRKGSASAYNMVLEQRTSFSNIGNDTQPEVAEIPYMEMHNAPTEANLRLPGSGTLENAEAVIKTPDVSLGPQRTPRFAQEYHPPIHETPVGTDLSRPFPPGIPHIPQPYQSYQQGRKKTGHSFYMLLLGGLLTVLLVIGAFASYIIFVQNATQQANNGRQATTTAAQKMPASLPPVPTAIAVGTQLYGTNLPGPQCDKQQGTWSKTENAQVACSPDRVVMTNSSASHLASMYLHTLPDNKPFPDNYIIQVQTTIDANSHGDFGVLFRNQPGANSQGAYAFMIDPAGLWLGTVYDTKGSATTLTNNAIEQGKLSGTVTIDVIVKNNRYDLYINGHYQGWTESSAYMSGNIGLAVETNTNVSFKNLAVYALP